MRTAVDALPVGIGVLLEASVDKLLLGTALSRQLTAAAGSPGPLH
jgi:hypothetical protein